MITDFALKFSKNQAVRATGASTDILDLGASRDIGDGTPLYLVASINASFNNLTSIAIELRLYDDDALANPVTITSTGAIPLANLALGNNHVLKIPVLINDIGKRFMGVHYIVAGTAPTAGAITTDIVLDYQEGKKIYPANTYVA